MIDTFYTRVAEPAAVKPPCVVFAWVGQSWEHCDTCNRPVTEHLYHPPYGGSRAIFHVKQWSKWSGWTWEPVGSLIERSK